ncbi:MAG: hypothetical protein ABFS28_12180 [Bacteroidota bacterium]
MRTRLLICSFILAFLLSACERFTGLPKTMEANYVKYSIEYMEKMAGDIPTRYLPAQMDSYYTKHYVLTRIDGLFNQFSLVQIADLKRKRVTTVLNFFGNRVFYRGAHGELPAGVKELNQLEYRYTGEKSVIGGLNSERIEIDTGKELFNVYSTKDFSVRQPNIVTPYQSINFPLTDFPIELSMLKMRLSCIGFESKIIESEIFKIPENYRSVSRQEMEEIINSLFTKD